MKILHTADLHLGHRFIELSQQEEQQAFLDWLVQYVDNQKIDLLLISGDVFDTPHPSNATTRMYYKFLIDIHRTHCKKVVITAGNHDAASTINAPKEILEMLDIYVVGKAPSSEAINEEVFSITVEDEEVIVAAVPFLRDQDIRKAMAGQQFEEIGDKYKKALIEHYDAVAEYCQSINTNQVPVIAMGHLFSIGGSTSTSDSERNVYVGGLGDIGSDDFSTVFDYVALGHLHRCQKIDKEHIRYSGSPYVLSFSEVHHDKKVIVLHLEDKQIKEIEEVAVPTFRNISVVRGNLEECLEALEQIPSTTDTLKPWVEVVVKTENNNYTLSSAINEKAETLPLEVLKVSLSRSKKEKKISREMSLQEVKELKVEDAFQLLCEQQDIDLQSRSDLNDAFLEIYRSIQE
ncbi:exonuclease SbcCD subunit D C-terminal domain-containing protein [Sediminitomix flava]|uniref:Nuclease SbcCD subunit D n=1 Tax=Sediminitomix flava TaxID=379075 RepID=A0A315ZWI9_SEDFL|nr:exonuclease SbcCD subunit D C-terminal domain-containing protein [Sediminitomix flava]PWJ41053.1 exodeoxyribonuclease I subunit D [Sediminitomix flava]